MERANVRYLMISYCHLTSNEGYRAKTYLILTYKDIPQESLNSATLDSARIK